MTSSHRFRAVLALAARPPASRFLPVSAEHRAVAGVEAGDEVDVEPASRR
jgi:hypothetical protein